MAARRDSTAKVMTSLVLGAVLALVGVVALIGAVGIPGLESQRFVDIACVEAEDGIQRGTWTRGPVWLCSGERTDGVGDRTHLMWVNRANGEPEQITATRLPLTGIWIAQSVALATGSVLLLLIGGALLARARIRLQRLRLAQAD